MCCNNFVFRVEIKVFAVASSASTVHYCLRVLRVLRVRGVILERSLAMIVFNGASSRL